MFDPQVLQIAVALVKRNGQLALTWNENWEAFVLPMTKLDSGPPAETAQAAAVRAAAQVFLLPCRVIPGQPGSAMRKLQLSASSGALNDYHFTVVPVEVHPDFAASSISHRPVIFAGKDHLLDGIYQPLSPSVGPIITACVEAGLL